MGIPSLVVHPFICATSLLSFYPIQTVLWCDSYWLPLDSYELLATQSMSCWPCPHCCWLNQDPSFLRMNCFLFTSMSCPYDTSTPFIRGAPVILTPRQSRTGMSGMRSAIFMALMNSTFLIVLNIVSSHPKHLHLLLYLHLISKISW